VDLVRNEKLVETQKTPYRVLYARNFQTSTHIRIRIVSPVPVELDLAEIRIRIPVAVGNLATRKALILVPLSVHISENLPRPSRFSVSNSGYFDRSIKRGTQFLFLANCYELQM